TGYPAFTRALRRLSAEYAFRDVTWHDVLRVVREETAPERRPALDTARAHWFQRTGAPEFALEWRRDGAVIRGTINQTAPHYETTIEIVPVGQGCSGTPHEVRVRGAATSFEIRRPGCTADSVALDPYYRTLRWTPELRAAALSLAGVTRAELLRRQGQLQAAREQYERVLAEGVPVPDRYFVRYFAENGLARVLLSLEDRDGARAHFQAALMAASRPPDGTASVLFELARIAHAAGDHGALRRYVDEVITAESLSGNPSGLAGPARALLQSVGSP
ncbi:hypothetical protein, partial [Longimicrobium sp.]|uniref:hypothetical protein n=1 Tax=Longimicrobium sp. TaxID=2029185 RepID=UPI002F94F581